MLNRRRNSGLIVALVVIASAAAAQSPDAQETPASQKFPRIGAALLEHVLAAAETRPSGSLIGIHDMSGDSRRLSIVSMRVAIAGLAAQAIERGSRYVPTESVLTGDAVFIECGDAALLGGFDCASLRVTTLAGQRIDPVGYAAGPRTIQSQGGKWTVSKAAGTFRVSDLRHGFTVTYVGTDDSEFMLDVSASDAAEVLLLALGEPAQSAGSTTSGAPDPHTPTLRLGLELLPDGGWLLSNQSLSRWTGCVVTVGDSLVNLPVLGVGGVVTLKPEQFSPAVDFDAPNTDFTLSVTCKVAEVTAVTAGGAPALF
jgi:hypothetical protein